MLSYQSYLYFLHLTFTHLFVNVNVGFNNFITSIHAFPSPDDLPDPGIEPGSSALQVDSLPSEPPSKA